MKKAIVLNGLFVFACCSTTALAGGRHFKPMNLNESNYRSVTLYKQPGADTFQWSALIPKVGQGTCYLKQSGGFAGLSLFSPLALEAGRKFSVKAPSNPANFDRIPLLTPAGADRFNYSALVPKNGKGPSFIERTGGFAGITGYSRLSLP